MKILILEDNPNRMLVFRTHLKDHEIDHFETAWLANEALKKNIYDIIYLDHDLGGQVYVDYDTINGTGTDTALVIPKTENRNARIVIHTHNPAGAQRMINIFKNNKIDHAYIPFGADTISIAFKDELWPKN